MQVVVQLIYYNHFFTFFSGGEDKLLSAGLQCKPDSMVTLMRTTG